MSHYRKIYHGAKYSLIIPKPTNKDVDFGSGDTFFTLEKMKKIVQDTLFQTRELSRILKGETTKKSIKNIKRFLYSHIQYLQDGQTQLLYSPSRTWQIRSIGVDCKSYSIFASSILSNLNIPHSFRQIKQANINPDYYSHVYVVIPSENMVIDSTVDYDYEPAYIEKYDYPVLSKGLGNVENENCPLKKDTNHNRVKLFCVRDKIETVQLKSKINNKTALKVSMFKSPISPKPSIDTTKEKVKQMALDRINLINNNYNG